MQHPLSDTISSNEEAFILRALEKGLRVDGRRLLEVRPIHIEFGAVPGTCELRLGQTRLLATATAELVEPYQDRAAEGLLQFSVEFSPMASPVFEPGRPSEAAVELTRLLERAIRKSQAIDVEALCVVPNKRVWSVRCDITVMDHRGNLTDAAVLAALAALRHLRLPGTACEAGLTRRLPSAITSSHPTSSRAPVVAIQPRVQPRPPRRLRRRLALRPVPGRPHDEEDPTLRPAGGVGERRRGGGARLADRGGGAAAARLPPHADRRDPRLLPRRRGRRRPYHSP